MTGPELVKMVQRYGHAVLLLPNRKQFTVKRVRDGVTLPPSAVELLRKHRETMVLFLGGEVEDGEEWPRMCGLCEAWAYPAVRPGGCGVVERCPYRTT